MSGTRAEDMIEPVHWGARLALVDDARYTEVADTAVALSATAAEVVQLTPEMASLALGLDGRPLRDALADELVGWDHHDRRRVIEVVRRLKTLGLLRDVPAGTRPDPVDWLHAPPMAEAVTVAGHVRPVDDGSGIGPVDVVLDGADAVGASAGDESDDPVGREVTIAVRSAMSGTEVMVADAATDGPTGAPIARLVLPVDGRSPREVLGTRGRVPVPAGPLDAFVALVAATSPRAHLAAPGVVDLLSHIAERAPSVWQHPAGDRPPDETA